MRIARRLTVDSGAMLGVNGATAFEVYLRTGRRGRLVEVKFNPWHDPDDGKFTFAGTGRYFPSGRGGSFRGGGASGDWQVHKRVDPRNPRNHTIYVVKQGDTLSRIAKLRNGLRVSDIAWLNSLQHQDSLRVGQHLMLPRQAYLEAGRRVRTNFLDLAFYLETHGGRLPSDVTQVPSIEEQVNSNWQSVVKNGYSFRVDIIKRTRWIDGDISLNLDPRRAKRLQKQAGGADRRSTDDGGHFIAPRFNGPRDWFNHFAQDLSFNRGAYRVIEDQWARHRKAGQRVSVSIIAHYAGTSVRPNGITVRWSVDGKQFRQTFRNERKGK